jgi:hypothetical protein
MIMSEFNIIKKELKPIKKNYEIHLVIKYDQSHA